MSGKRVTIVEVGPRDGFQSIGPMIPTARKVELIGALHAAGVRRMEATAFVSPSAVPQLADAAEVLAAAQALDGLDAQVLVPTLRHAERALGAGARHLSFVLSVAPKHNMSKRPAQPGGVGRGIRAHRRDAARRNDDAAEPRHRLRLPLRRPGRAR